MLTIAARGEMESEGVLLSISLMAEVNEHFFMCLLAIYISFEDCLFNSFVYVLIMLFVLLVFNFFSYLYILDINPLSDRFEIILTISIKEEGEYNCAQRLLVANIYSLKVLVASY
jgi:hypothetical protein